MFRADYCNIQSAITQQSMLIEQDKLINCYSNQHQQVLVKSCIEMSYSFVDFSLELNAFFTLSISSMDSILSISFS